MGRREIERDVIGFARQARPRCLDDLDAAIDWDLLDPQSAWISPPGRCARGWPPLALLDTLLLGSWRDLCDVKLEDLASFRRICGFCASEAIPERMGASAATDWRGRLHGAISGSVAGQPTFIA